MLKHTERLTAWTLVTLTWLSGCAGNIGESSAKSAERSPDEGTVSNQEPDSGPERSNISGDERMTAPTDDAESSGDDRGLSEVEPYQPPEARLRRLTRTQFHNALESLLGKPVITDNMPSDNYEEGFAVVGASTIATSPLGVERYHHIVEENVELVFADEVRRKELLGCVVSTWTDPCAQGYLHSQGRLAFRRDLTDEEVEQLAHVAEVAEHELGDAYAGLQWATVALLTSPNFLYRSEWGSASTAAAQRLTGYAMASRLVFALWNRPPDEELLDEAALGNLDTAEGVNAAARHLLTANYGHEAIGSFVDEYMRLDRIAGQHKDPAMFPEYTPALQAGMVTDMRSTWQELAFVLDGNALDLFTTETAVVNADLAHLYGINDEGLSSTDFKVIDLPTASGYGGILSKPAFLSQFANQTEGSPTLRGKFIREAVLCTPIPPPPAGVTVEFEDSSDATTKREKLAMHRTDPTCSGCHSLMDPLGLPLESFDAIGRFRTEDQGEMLDLSGEVDGTLVSNASELGLALSKSTGVARCLVSKYYTYVLGYKPRPEERPFDEALYRSFSESGYKLKQLILDAVATDAFQLVSVAKGVNDVARNETAY